MSRSPVLLGLLLAACKYTPIHEVNERYRDALLQRDLNYRIKAGDQVSIKFYKLDAEMNQALLVLPDGHSDPFFMDDAILAGKTVKELEEDIKKYYVAQIPANQEVSVQVVPTAESIIVEGELARPGTANSGVSTQPFTPKMTLSQALGNAGGYKITACLHSVVVRRSYLDPKHPEVFRVNLRDYPDIPEELFLLPNDHIMVERNLVILVRDYINEYVWGFLPPFFSGVLTGGLIAGI
jgi:protein involved in polysaccharide export with SLBB domain